MFWAVNSYRKYVKDLHDYYESKRSSHANDRTS